MSRKFRPQPLRRLLGPFGRFFLWDVLLNPHSRPIFIWVGVLLILGSMVYHYVEGWGWLDSLYFCVVTLTTVGYGDLSPTQPVSKIFTIFYILNGLGVLLAFIDRVSDLRRENFQQRRQARQGQ